MFNTAQRVQPMGVSRGHSFKYYDCYLNCFVLSHNCMHVKKQVLQFLVIWKFDESLCCHWSSLFLGVSLSINLVYSRACLVDIMVRNNLMTLLARNKKIFFWVQCQILRKLIIATFIFCYSLLLKLLIKMEKDYSCCNGKLLK